MQLPAAAKRIITISGLLITFIVSADKRSIIDNIELARQAFNMTNDGHIHAAFFVPKNPVKKILLGLIENEKQSIEAALYRITDIDVATALIEAMKLRQVAVHLIIDHGCLLDQYEKVSMLANEGVDIHKYMNGSTLMHNKFWLFKNNFGSLPILVTGSTNCTRSGLTRNEENMVVTNDAKVVKSYQENFDQLYYKTQSFTAMNAREDRIKGLTEPIRKINRETKKVFRLVR